MEEGENEYRNYPSDAFVVSGPLKPFVKHGTQKSSGQMTVRCLLAKQFNNVDDAFAWAEDKYTVYEDVSRPEIGLWGFRVRPKAQRASELLNEQGGVVLPEDAAREAA